jgi:hypothetical protein
VCEAHPDRPSAITSPEDAWSLPVRRAGHAVRALHAGWGATAAPAGFIPDDQIH